MKRTVLVMLLLFIAAGLAFSDGSIWVPLRAGVLWGFGDPDPPPNALGDPDPPPSALGDPDPPLLVAASFGLRYQKVLGIGLDVVLANGMGSWDPRGGMDLLLWLGPLYAGGGFMVPLSMIGFPENSAIDEFLVKAGLEFSLFWLGPGKVIINGGLVAPWSVVSGVFQNPGQFSTSDLTFAASLGWKLGKRQ